MQTLHRIAAATALGCVALFWSATVAVELFGSPGAVAGVKSGIVYGLGVLVPALALTGITGIRLAARRGGPIVAAKQRRMPWIAANGLLVLVPAAVYLDRLAAAGEFATTFYAVQALELIAGAANLWLLSRNFRLGLSLARA